MYSYTPKISYLISGIISKEIFFKPVSIVIVESLDMVVVELLVVVGISEDGSAGHSDGVQILTKGVPHLTSVSPKLVVIMEPFIL